SPSAPREARVAPSALAATPDRDRTTGCGKKGCGVRVRLRGRRLAAALAATRESVETRRGASRESFRADRSVPRPSPAATKRGPIVQGTAPVELVASGVLW